MSQDLFHIPLALVNREQIHSLLTRRLVETRHMEYKREIPMTRDEARAVKDNKEKKKDPFFEFACDVSAFANTDGGDILFGIGPDEHKRPIFVGVPEETLDHAKSHITNLVYDNIEPQIQAVNFQTVPYEDGKAVLIMRIPKSIYGPHQVSIGRSKFWTRTAAGKISMDYQALHTAFTANVEIIERARDWRAKRLERIYADLPFGIFRRPLQILHLIPLSFKNAQGAIRLATIAAMSGILRPASKYSITNDRFTADGYASILERDENNLVPGYTQVYRNGQTESVTVVETGLFREYFSIYSLSLEREFVNALERYLCALRLSGVNPPILISLAYQNMAGLRMIHNSLINMISQEITTSDAIFPDIVITGWPDKSEILEIAKSLLDCLWQAAGVEKSLNYPWTDLEEQDLEEYSRKALDSLI